MTVLSGSDETETRCLYDCSVKGTGGDRQLAKWRITTVKKTEEDCCGWLDVVSSGGGWRGGDLCECDLNV